MCEGQNNFSHGVFFDWREPDRLSVESPEEAIYEWLSSDFGFDLRDDPENIPNSELEAELKKACPFLVTAYAPEPPTEKELERWGMNITESWCEMFGEEYGDPEDYEDPKGAEKAQEIFIAASKEAAKHMHVWRCKEVGTKHYSFEELLAVAKEGYPEWWETEGEEK